MNNTITYVAMDTHKKEHKVALHYPCNEEIVRFAVKNNVRDIKKMVNKIKKQAPADIKFCYEAGVCGFTLKRRIEALGCQNSVMSLLGNRRSEIVKMDAKSGAGDFVHMEFLIPSRGLFGLHAKMMNATAGRAIMHHTFERYEPMRGAIPQRKAGVMIATTTGQVTAYALDALYDRGVFFVEPGEQVYEGQVVGEHCKEKDIPVNVVRSKQL